MSAESVRIRPVHPDDLDAVAAIYAYYVANSVATFDEVAPTADDWRAKAHDLWGRRLPFLVAEDDWQVVGFAYAGPWRPKPAYRHTAEDTIYISPDHLSKGLGRTLLSTLLPLCADAGVRRVLAVIADGGDDSSAKLHQSFGFTEAGRLTAVGFKHERWLDTVLYQLELAPRVTPEAPQEPIA
ncbi:GNAT family N-acetyltransferase [Yinghuangia seranimata]|uniref:GNAT family N-acetyltransferase n=1 Tax=Yinghuangia seranimata TaxID=408067 RepID=UPI00248CEA42|nr:GNAT family N-acetyltransferase [Yinghuangia seranimata]MDI2126536.1 N-acetyltransferase family protein [Yinghuangia seranimata]